MEITQEKQRISKHVRKTTAYFPLVPVFITNVFVFTDIDGKHVI